MDDNKNSKIELRIFTSNYIDKLNRSLKQKQWVKNYNRDNFPAENKSPRGTSGLYIEKDFKLNPNEPDFVNSIAIFNQLKLTPAQASDERLWAYLAHVVFWDYMQGRWPVKDNQNKESFIKDRYFLRNPNLRSLTHNGISRLWWFAYLTYDKTRSNKWELTEILFKRSDLPTSLLERYIGSNENIRFAVLEYFIENPSALTSKSIQKILKWLNLVGGVKNLPFLEVEEIKEILYTFKPSI